MIQEGLQVLDQISYAMEIADRLNKPISEVFTTDDLYSIIDMYDGYSNSYQNPFSFGVAVLNSLFEQGLIQEIAPGEICDPALLRDMLTGDFVGFVEEFQGVDMVREVELQSGIKIESIEESLYSMTYEQLYNISVGVLDTMLDSKITVNIINEIEADYISETFKALGFMLIKRIEQSYTFAFTYDYLVSSAYASEELLLAIEGIMELRRG